MISSLKRLIVGTAAVIGFAGSANAAFVPATWTDTIGGSHYIGAGSSYSYQHNITDPSSGGFAPLNDFITSFSLAIDLYDDKRDGWFEYEIAEIDIAGGLPDGYVTSFGFGNDAYTGWSLTGLIQLNALGTLNVTVTSICAWLVCSDFVLGTSSLVARGYSKVPEPGTIALLGLGLLGIGLGRRKLAK